MASTQLTAMKIILKLITKNRWIKKANVSNDLKFMLNETGPSQYINYHIWIIYLTALRIDST